MKQLDTIALAVTGLLVSGAAVAGIHGGQADTFQAVPVPGVLALIAAGAGALYLFRRK